MFKRAHKTDYIAFNLELVKAVEKHPCLYDYSLKEYCNREFVQETWEKLAKNFNCTAKECKDTWKNLRIVFSRNVKKRNSGGGGKRKPYYLLESMSYLIPFMKFDNSSPKPLKPVSETIYDETTSDEQTSNKDDEDDDINSFIEPTVNITSSELAIKEECDSEDEGLLEEIPIEPPKKKHKTSNEVNSLVVVPMKPPKENQKTQFSDTSATSLCDCSKSNTDVSRTSRENSKHQFLLSLSPDVEDMNDAQFRSFRLEVCKLVSNIFTFQPPTSQPSSRNSS